jgi:hypothetical protein
VLPAAGFKDGFGAAIHKVDLMRAGRGTDFTDSREGRPIDGAGYDNQLIFFATV